MSNSSRSAEMRGVLGAALPIMGAQLGTMGMNVVDTMMVGHIGTEALAAAALATQWASVGLMFGMGVVMGIDPAISQAYGGGDRAGVARGLQHGLVVAGGVSLAVMAFWLLLEPFLIAWGQPPELAARAQAYLNVQLPSVPFFLGGTALRSYLRSRNLNRPAWVVTVLANALNVLLNFALIFGIGRFPGWGLTGAGLATALSRCFLTLLLWAWVWRFGLHKGYWLPLGRAALSPRPLLRVLSLGVPLGVSLLAEVLAFSGSTFLAARLGAVAIGAHAVVLNLAGLAYMAPLGLAMSASARIGQHVGRGALAQAQRTIEAALALCVALMLAVGAAVFLLKQSLPLLYTQELSVALMASHALPIVAAFQLVDGAQVVAAGLLRGMGRTRVAMAANIVGYYVIGLPLGAWLAYSAGLGIDGIWWGLFAGLCVVAAALLTWLSQVRWRPIVMRGAEGLDAPV